MGRAAEEENGNQINDFSFLVVPHLMQMQIRKWPLGAKVPRSGVCNQF